MWLDIALTIGLGLAVFAFGAVGVHASISPVSPDDSLRPFWQRHRTKIWISLAAIAVFNISIITVQAYRQAASSFTRGDLLALFDKQNNLILAAGGASKVPASPPNASPTHNDLVQNVKRRETIAKALSDTFNGPTPYASQSLTPAQISLIGLSASGIARDIDEGFNASLKRQEDIQQAIRQDAEDEMVRHGRKREDAHAVAFGGQVGGGYLEEQNSMKIAAAGGAIEAHRTQLDALVNLVDDPTSKAPKALLDAIANVTANCHPGLGPSPDSCTTALGAVAMIAK